MTSKKLETHLSQGLHPVGNKIINLYYIFLLTFPLPFCICSLIFHLLVLCLVDIYLQSLKFSCLAVIKNLFSITPNYYYHHEQRQAGSASRNSRKILSTIVFFKDRCRHNFDVIITSFGFPAILKQIYTISCLCETSRIMFKSFSNYSSKA